MFKRKSFAEPVFERNQPVRRKGLNLPFRASGTLEQYRGYAKDLQFRHVLYAVHSTVTVTPNHLAVSCRNETKRDSLSSELGLAFSQIKSVKARGKKPAKSVAFWHVTAEHSNLDTVMRQLGTRPPRATPTFPLSHAWSVRNRSTEYGARSAGASGG